MRQQPQPEQASPLQQQAIALDVQNLINTYRLGTPIKEYRNNAGAWMAGGIGCITVGVIFTVGGLLLLLTLFASFNLSLLASGIALVVTGLALFVNHGISLIRRSRRNQGAQVYLCTNGLLLIKDREADVMRWDQIVEIWQGFSVFSSYGRQSYVLNRLVLRGYNRPDLIVDDAFRGFREILAEVERKVVSHLLPGALAAYHAGHVVSFGPISVDSRGISVSAGKGREQKTISWQDLDKVKIASGVIYFKGHALLPLTTVPVGEVPNACVFATLVSAVAGGQKLQLA